MIHHHLNIIYWPKKALWFLWFIALEKTRSLASSLFLDYRKRSNDEHIKRFTLSEGERWKLYVLNQNKQVVDIEKYLHNICVYVNIWEEKKNIKSLYMTKSVGFEYILTSFLRAMIKKKKKIKIKQKENSQVFIIWFFISMY